MNHLSSEADLKSWGSEGSGVRSSEHWPSQGCGSANGSGNFLQDNCPVGQESKLTCALGGFPFGGELDVDISLTTSLDSRTSVAKLCTCLRASVSWNWFLRQALHVLFIACWTQVFGRLFFTYACGLAWLTEGHNPASSLFMVTDYLDVSERFSVDTKNEHRVNKVKQSKYKQDNDYSKITLKFTEY